MERLRIEQFSNLAMKTNPGTIVDAKNPRSRIVGRSFQAKRSGGDQLPLSIVPAGTPATVGVTPETTGVASPDGTKMTVFRFVLCEEAACHAKRIVVDVLPIAADNEHGYQHGYYELQSTVVNPEVEPT
jgi:hypothetical protein